MYGEDIRVENMHALFEKTRRTYQTNGIPIHKKRNRRDRCNYRTITLPNSDHKLLTKMFANKIIKRYPISEEQQPKNRSTTDAIFIVRQIAEKGIEFNIPVYMCFLGPAKAFDIVRLRDVMKLLKENNQPKSMVTDDVLRA